MPTMVSSWPFVSYMRTSTFSGLHWQERQRLQRLARDEKAALNHITMAAIEMSSSLIGRIVYLGAHWRPVLNSLWRHTQTWTTDIADMPHAPVGCVACATMVLIAADYESDDWGTVIVQNTSNLRNHAYQSSSYPLNSRLQFQSINPLKDKWSTR